MMIVLFHFRKFSENVIWMKSTHGIFIKNLDHGVDSIDFLD